MATEIITSNIQITDANGDPVNGAKVYVYAVTTTTPLSLFSDTALGNSAANPIVCDSSGRHDMRYVATGSYKIVVKTSADVTIYTRDNIDGRVPVGTGALAIANGGTGATSAGAALTALGGATAAELADLAADVASLSGTLASTEKTHIATGTTAQRPASPAEGDIRRNTSTSRWEFYNGTSWQNMATAYPTRQYLTSGSGATYTTPANCTAIRVRIRGGGGGGGGSSGGGGTGGTTTFNSISAAGGSGGGSSTACTGGAGGTGGAGSADFTLRGSDGAVGSASTFSLGGNGAPGIWGLGAGRGGTSAGGTAGGTNTGAGGGGLGDTNKGGGGGGAGEEREFLITGPSATYTYTIGAGGTAGSGSGVAGGSGVIIVEEYY